MTETENPLLRQARDVLAGILTTIPEAKLEWDLFAQNDQTHLAGLASFMVSMSRNHRLDTLVIGFKDQGHPKQLREAISQLLRYRHQSNRPDYLVVAAPFISADGAKVCGEENVGYYDLAGNCRLIFGNTYIERIGHPNPFRKEGPMAPSLYGPRSERVLRVLFDGREWKVVPLAAEAHVSTGTVSIVRNLLLEREWAVEGPAGVRLTHPKKLLRDWASVWQRRREKPKMYFTLLPLAEIEARMAEFARDQGRLFALTGTAGAWRLAPMTRYSRTQAYWAGDPVELANALGLKPAEEGANVHLYLPRDEGVFFRGHTIERVPVVSTLQLYLDLQRDPARGEEAAEHLWSTQLFPNDGE